MITSRTNENIKYVVELVKSAPARRDSNCYIVEGPRMFAEIPKTDILKVFVAGSFKNRELLEGILPDIIFETSDDVFAKMSDTKNPQGILAVVKMPKYALSDMLGAGPLLILENIQDPGNLGTMFRSGEAAGIGGIITDRKTADAFNPKVIRSTMGAIFRVPYLVSEDLAKTIAELKGEEYTIYAAHLNGENYFTKPLDKKSAFLIGNEGNGLSDEISALSDKLIRIPMEGKVESLNAAVSASLLAYEWHRQHLS